MNINRRLVLLLSVVCLSACSMFVDRYDAVRHDHFKKLQSFHQQFIDDLTTGSEFNWSVEQVTELCNSGQRLFDDALNYTRAKGEQDHTTVEAFEILSDQFSDDCSFSIRRGKSFSGPWAEEHQQQLRELYNQAIEGELTRLSQE